MTTNRLSSITPGELLQDEFGVPLGISQYRLPKAIGVPASRISEIITGQLATSVDSDLRLCRAPRPLMTWGWQRGAGR